MALYKVELLFKTNYWKVVKGKNRTIIRINNITHWTGGVLEMI